MGKVPMEGLLNKLKLKLLPLIRVGIPNRCVNLDVFVAE
jgi:hypothetical protein